MKAEKEQVPEKPGEHGTLKKQEQVMDTTTLAAAAAAACTAAYCMVQSAAPKARRTISLSTGAATLKVDLSGVSPFAVRRSSWLRVHFDRLPVITGLAGVLRPRVAVERQRCGRQPAQLGLRHPRWPR